MPGIVLDGKALAQHIEQELAGRVARLKARSGGRPPSLATILVGDDPASATYVRMKGNAKCSAHTPVPGGVGPMTIATLIAQTVEAAEKHS